ncbi:hypothetical protein L0152_22330 [bacterium]|nr:hypothetical protein [bacterium]
MRNLNEVLSDIAENTEALKRNWFFRGFFKKRGYYDIDNLTVADYLIIRKDHEEKRFWLASQDLFEKSGDKEMLTARGKDLIREKVKGLFQYIENNPIYLSEGYASQCNAGDQYIASRNRALTVRTFVENEFPVPSESLGILPIGLKVNETGEAWDGVSLVAIFEEGKKKK